MLQGQTQFLGAQICWRLDFGIVCSVDKQDLVEEIVRRITWNHKRFTEKGRKDLKRTESKGIGNCVVSLLEVTSPRHTV